MTTENEDSFLPARAVWKRYGVSDMSLFRWVRDEKLGFPAPTYIGRYRYWRLDEIQAWERALPKRRSSRHEEAA